jgi:hypothetical protein
VNGRRRSAIAAKSAEACASVSVDVESVSFSKLSMLEAVVDVDCARNVTPDEPAVQADARSEKIEATIIVFTEIALGALAAGVVEPVWFAAAASLSSGLFGSTPEYSSRCRSESDPPVSAHDQVLPSFS